jgi:hypothetical protein
MRKAYTAQSLAEFDRLRNKKFHANVTRSRKRRAMEKATQKAARRATNAAR